MLESTRGVLIGQVINGYRILERLGAGGMGVVYRAADTRLDRDVALKFISAADHDEKAHEGLINEARAASKLDHPNIGTIYGIEDSPDGQRFIVMACYSGQPLSQKLQDGPLPAGEAAAIALDVAKGLAAAHALKIIHRDIKPSNILLTSQGLVKVIDFGIARVVRSASATQTSAFSGTASYMSPEQAEGKPLDVRTDIWSLGVVLYEMATGCKPFEGESTLAVLFAIVNKPPRPIDEGVPAPLRRVIYRALAKKREARYQNAEEMIEDLRSIAGARPSPMSSPGWYGPTRTAVLNEPFQAPATGTWSWRTSMSGRLWLLLAAGMLVFFAVLLLTPVRYVLAPGWFHPPPAHIAVLPITMKEMTADDEVLSDGLMESLTSRLSNLQAARGSLWIVPASEVRRLKVTDAAAARKVLGANLVVTAALQRNPRGVGLTVNLVNAEDVRLLGSARLEEANGDFPALQDAAVDALAGFLNIRSPKEPSRVAGSSQTPAAYEAYLKALGYISRYDKPGNLEKAISMLNAAIQTDPNFALAYAALGEAYRRQAALSKDTTLLAAASDSATHALQLNDGLAPVHVAMAQIQSALGNREIALTEFQKALQLDPSNDDAIGGLAAVYEAQHRTRDAEDAYRRAAALRPDYWQGYNHLGVFLKGQKRYVEAENQFRRVIELTPDNAAGYANLAAVLIDEDKLKEAQAPLEKAAKLTASYAIYANLGQLYRRERRFTEAAQATEKALKMNDKDWRIWSNMGAILLSLNRNTEATNAYRRSLPLLEAAVKVQPGDATLQARLAETYAFCGRREASVARIEAALALAPNDSSVLLACADAYEVLGDREHAIQMANRAVKAGLKKAELEDDPEARRLEHDSRLTLPAM